VAMKGVFKLRRNDTCNECGECELVCPTNEATDRALKQECYLCNRCVEACKRNGISYGRSKA
jgi:ferredoxin-type protein NapH